MILYKFDTEYLAYKKINTIKYILLGAFLMICVFILSSFILFNDNTRYINTELEVDLITNNSFTKKRLISEIKRYNFKYPDIVMAQAIIESQHFKSPVFRENHNMLGMKEAKQRLTTAKGTNLNHAYYDNWKDCVVDRLLYDAVYLNDLSRADYLKYLDRVYAEATDYDKLIERVIESNNLKEVFKK